MTFKPAWWCPGAHLQTLWANRLRPRPPLALRRERIELADGDFVDLDWTSNSRGPIVLMLHGLQGSSNSRYARSVLGAVDRAGWRGALLHFRGCSGEPNRLPRAYHSGETGDLDQIVQLLHQREPSTAIAVIGVSLGGNVLLKWLGETGDRAPVVAAVAISVPYELSRAADKLDSGFSRLYQWDLMFALRNALEQKRRQVVLPLTLTTPLRFRSIRDFDDRVTAPLHGFRDAAHYYSVSSARQYLKHIAVPTLLIHALDDPFMVPDVVPKQHELADCVTLDIHRSGGHVGFVAGRWPWRPHYWLEERVPAFLRSFIPSPAFAGKG
ncbi:MAG: hydrolase [Gammaproteobacteria bacterium]|nr:hydrolase [Gammaproteobacteria bacterium]